MGLPGFWEVLILLIVGIIVFVVPVAILLVILYVLKSQSRPGPVAAGGTIQCPSCQMLVASNSVYCSACGKKLMSAETPSATN